MQSKNKCEKGSKIVCNDTTLPLSLPGLRTPDYDVKLKWLQ